MIFFVIRERRAFVPFLDLRLRRQMALLVRVDAAVMLRVVVVVVEVEVESPSSPISNFVRFDDFLFISASLARTPAVVGVGCDPFAVFCIPASGPWCRASVLRYEFD